MEKIKVKGARHILKPFCAHFLMYRKFKKNTKTIIVIKSWRVANVYCRANAKSASYTLLKLTERKTTKASVFLKVKLCIKADLHVVSMDMIVLYQCFAFYFYVHQNF